MANDFDVIVGRGRLDTTRCPMRPRGQASERVTTVSRDGVLRGI